MNTSPHVTRRPWIPSASTAIACLALATFQPALALGQTQVKAQAPPSGTPAWNKGILPISSASYYHAIECGKQGGQNPPCVFWDTGLCKNGDFTLAMYTPYKSVAYEVWRVVQAGQSPPQPNYQTAQRARVTVGIGQAQGTKNPIKSVVVRRGGKAIAPTSHVMERTGGRFTFDFPAFAPTASITIDMVGETGTVSCHVDQSVLSLLR